MISPLQEILTRLSYEPHDERRAGLMGPTYQPGSCDVEPSLSHRNLDIENLRPETGAQNWPIAVDDPENRASETA